MHFLVAFLCVVGFPALATRVVQRRGSRGLATVTATFLGSLVLLGLALASPRLGNRLTPTEGYGPMAARILLTLGLSIAMPLVLSAAIIYLVERAGREPGVIFGAGLAASLCGFAFGVLLLFAIV